IEVGDRDEEVRTLVAARRARVEPARAERAGLERYAPARRARAAACQHADDAARVRAVDEALRPAQHLDALDVARDQQRLEGRDGLRAARIDRLDAVDQQHRPVTLFAADAQRGELAGAAAVRHADARL